jgi:hypothetical protein
VSACKKQVLCKREPLKRFSFHLCRVVLWCCGTPALLAIWTGLNAKILRWMHSADDGHSSSLVGCEGFLKQRSIRRNKNLEICIEAIYHVSIPGVLLVKTHRVGRSAYRNTFYHCSVSTCKRQVLCEGEPQKGSPFSFLANHPKKFTRFPIEFPPISLSSWFNSIVKLDFDTPVHNIIEM